MQIEIKNWLDQAKKDLNAARHSLNSKNFDWASFQAQQAAEKALKALYIKTYNELRKVHDLVLLARKLGLPTDLIEFCVKLNKVYIETRYPDASGIIPALKFSYADGQKSIEMASNLLQWIEKQL